MGQTTITLEELLKERLESYRHPEHDNIGEVIGDLMEWVEKPVDILADGCTHCGETPRRADAPIGEMDGVVHSYAVDLEDGRTVTGTEYYCSPECAHREQEERAAQFPDEPDEVRVGGVDELEVTLTDATSYFSETDIQVGLDIPGAFDGESAHSGEYHYEGEPVYIKNEGSWVHEGVVEEIIHEDAHTTLIVGRDLDRTRLHHPDPEMREQFLSEWRIGEHDCGDRVKFRRGDGPDGTCPHCEEELTEETFEEHDDSEGFSPDDSAG